MATLAAISKIRKSQLRSLLIASRRLDTAQEKLERELKRMVNRKRAVPDLEDGERLAKMAQEVDAAVTSIAAAIQSMSNSWGMQY